MTEKKILIASGDPILLGILKNNLSANGYKIMSTKDSDHKLEATLDKALPDLIILDIMMPSLDGIEVCLRIRRRCEAPIIMLTTWGAGKDMVRGLDLSSDCYLTSPFGITELIAQIEEAFSHNSTSGNHHQTSLTPNNEGDNNLVVTSANCFGTFTRICCRYGVTERSFTEGIGHGKG